MREEPKLRVLVVDDSPAYRAMIVSIISGIDYMEVAGVAADGKIALEQIQALRPDLVTLDIAMPQMDGLETLRQLKLRGDTCGVVMVSAFTVAGAAETIEALGLGAFDFIAKPDSADLKANIEGLRKQLIRVGRSFFSQRLFALLRNGSGKNPKLSAPQDISSGCKCGIVAIGVSTGGPKALLQLIPALPPDFPAPVVVVQHMPPVFTAALAQSLNRKSRLRVMEAAGGTAIEPGKVYLAPGGRQMKVRLDPDSASACLVLTDDPAENGCRPSADYFFRSVAGVFRERAIGIIMTGMGRDGTEGLKLMKEAGARVIAQDEQSCVVFGMPLEAIRAGVVDTVLPLDKIPDEIVRLVDAG